MGRLPSALLASLVLVACSQPQGPGSSPVAPRILSPSAGQVFFEGNPVVLVADPGDPQLVWQDDHGTPLGKGSPLVRTFVPGAWSVQVADPKGQRARVLFSVVAGEKESSLRQVTQVPFSFPDGQPRTRWFAVSTATDGHASTIDPGSVLVRGMALARRLSVLGSRRYGARDLGGASSRSFDMVDPTGDGTSGWTFRADRLASTQDVVIWVEQGTTLDPAAWAAFWPLVRDHVITRFHSLWGNWGDVDGNGVVNVVLSPRINQGKAVVGFFNPLDLFPKNSDATNAQYNPFTNEGETLYLAVPESDPVQPLFSARSIASTVAHEGFHLWQFYHQTYLPLQNGQTSSPNEEVFLAEGLAHLTESLTGLGQSGGNLLFAGRWLEHPEAYSLRYSDQWGRGDSVGRRGMVATFLSWLFWRQGGMSAEGSRAIDQGGLAWARRLAVGTTSGWASFQRTLANPEGLYLAWVQELAASENPASSPPTAHEDPVTSEPWEVAPGVGGLGLPTVATDTGNLVVLPFGLLIVEAQAGHDRTSWTFSSWAPPLWVGAY